MSEIAGEPGPGVDAVLTIFRHLPGLTVAFAEGTRLNIRGPGLDFVEHEELAVFTLFHVVARAWAREPRMGSVTCRERRGPLRAAERPPRKRWPS